MNRKARVTVYGLLILAAGMICLLYYTGTQENEVKLRQDEVVWNTEEELRKLSEIESIIARAKTGDADVIPVSTNATGYETICPGMQAEDAEHILPDNAQGEKKVYLTFDDGPSRQTEKVLDILDRYQIKASFFVVSANLTESGTEALKRAAAAGHVIGMHSDTHDYKKIYTSVESLLKDYEKVYNMIKETTGLTPRLYRFPGGSYNSVGRQCILQAIPEMERRGFAYYDWNVTAEDAVGHPTASSIKKNIFRELQRIESPVILMHDGSCNSLTVEVLPEIIDELVRRGYSFDTLDHREPCCFQW